MWITPKKSLGNKLHELKKTHKELSETVTKATQKNFAYAMNQNMGDPEGLKKTLKAIPEHMFVEHNGCGSWCGYNKNRDRFFHYNLPSGKDLSSDALRKELQTILNAYGDNSNKLAQQGSL